MPTDRDFSNHFTCGADRATSEVMGVSDVHFLDASSADASAPDTFNNCRAIKCDSAGIVKITYREQKNGDEHTEVLYLERGLFTQYRNVIKLFQYYVGQTDGTAESYNAAGSLITNAIKLYR